MRRFLAAVIMAMLFACLLSSVLIIRLAKAETIIVPDNYPKIQEAINNAEEGDTVFVRNGTYPENVVVNKTVVLVGESKESTIINDSQAGSVVTVNASNVEVSGFTIMNSGAAWEGNWWDSGILLVNCSDCRILNNSVTSNWCGIWLQGSAKNTVAGNNVSANLMRGIVLVESVNNTVVENSAADNEEGISLLYSFNNSLSSNVLAGNQYNFGVIGETPDQFIQNIDTSNMVDGKPVYYLLNKSDIVINPSTYPSVGFLALINSRNVTVEGLEVENNTEGLLLANTTDSWIMNNKFANNVYGISLVISTNNMVRENNVTINEHGVELAYSGSNIVSGNSIAKNRGGVVLISADNNTLTGNDFAENSVHGVNLIDSRFNVLAENNFVLNTYGVWLDSSTDNRFYHNNFIGNTHHVYLTPEFEQLPNVWDDGYPSGGNYWSNYTGVDLLKGCYQNETGSDGIGDMAYGIDGNNTDGYPLMEKWEPAAIPADINHDGIVDILDIVTAATIYGCRQGEPEWNSEADLAAPYGVINMQDLVTICFNYGKKSP
jgi:parallel beta-helix repeat protein